MSRKLTTVRAMHGISLITTLKERKQDERAELNYNLEPFPESQSHPPDLFKIKSLCLCLCKSVTVVDSLV